MNIKKTITALTMIAGMSAGTVQASGTYIGINFGKSDGKEWVSEEDVTQIFLAAGTSAPTSGHGDTADSAMKILFGVATSDNIDLRLGYANLGEATFEASNGIVNAEGSVENQGVFADLLARFKPAERLSLYGKMGLAFMKTDITFNAIGPGGFYEDELQGSSFVFVPGVGISLDITERFGLTAEYERYLDVGDDEETGTSDIDVVSAGVYIRF